VQLLVDTWPEGLQQKRSDGCTPLHLACSNNASLDVVSVLLDGWPAALIERSNDGNTPLHVVYQRQTSLDVLSLLCRSWPDAVQLKRTKDGAHLYMWLASFEHH